jgi:hypothetical protein
VIVETVGRRSRLAFDSLTEQQVFARTHAVRQPEAPAPPSRLAG